MLYQESKCIHRITDLSNRLEGTHVKLGCRVCTRVGVRVSVHEKQNAVLAAESYRILAEIVLEMRCYFYRYNYIPSCWKDL